MKTYWLIFYIAITACDYSTKEFSDPKSIAPSGKIVFNQKRAESHIIKYKDSIQLDYKINAVASDERNFYFLDGINQHIYKLDDTGYLTKIGGSKGEGPEELGNTIDLSVDGVGIYLFDAGNRRFKKLLTTGITQYELSLRNSLNQASYWKNDLFVGSEGSKNQLDFYTFNVETKEQRKLSFLKTHIAEGPNSDIIHDGKFHHSLSSDMMFYFMAYKDDFFGFNEDSIVVKGNLIYTVPPPDIHVKENLRSVVSATNGVYDVSIANGLIYVLSGILWKKDKDSTMAIDIYAEKDGKYIGTCRVPNIKSESYNYWANFIQVNGEKIYVLHEESKLFIGTITSI